MAKEKLDIITLELVNNFLCSIVDEMTLAVIRTSFSPITRDAFDFECGLTRANGEMILEGEGTLLHAEVYPTLINNWVKAHAESTYPGDLIATNDPYQGAGHLPDIYMWHPIFNGDELVAWSVAGGHVRDIGGRTPGSCACDSREIYQEGLRFPPMKLYERGIPNQTLFDIIGTMSRTPEIVKGDIEAFGSACHIGEIRFLELVKTYGWEFLSPYMDELLDYSERLARAEIKKMPDGEYEFTDYLDDNGVDFDKQVTIKVKITVKDDTITCDFTGTGPQVKGAMNNPVGNARANTVTIIRYLMDPGIPRNSGSLRPVKIILPEGTLLNPKLPGACSSRTATVGRQCDAMLGAMAQIAPDKIPACAAEGDYLVNMGGRDKDGKPWILMEMCWGGWGGRSFADGIDYNTILFMNGGNIPCEVNEDVFPIMYNQYGYLPDREGAGKYRGSVALVREYKLVCDEAILQLRADRQRSSPYGLYGGKPGTPSEAIMNPDTEHHNIGKITMDIKKGDVLRLITPGAGGWGDPLERDPKLVLKDVRDEKVSAKRAREAYGVVINETVMEVDIAETNKLRGKIKEARR